MISELIRKFCLSRWFVKCKKGIMILREGGLTMQCRSISHAILICLLAVWIQPKISLGNTQRYCLFPTGLKSRISISLTFSWFELWCLFTYYRNQDQMVEMHKAPIIWLQRGRCGPRIASSLCSYFILLQIKCWLSGLRAKILK